MHPIFCQWANVYDTDWIIGFVLRDYINPSFFYRRRSFFRRAMYKRDQMKSTETTTNSQLEMSDRHVYANPSYAGHFEIGGMPFYLPSPPTNDAKSPTKMSEEGESNAKMIMKGLLKLMMYRFSPHRKLLFL